MTSGADVVLYRIVKRLSDGSVIYDRIRHPWYAPWRMVRTRYKLGEKAFACLTLGRKTEGELK